MSVILNGKRFDVRNRALRIEGKVVMHISEIIGLESCENIETLYLNSDKISEIQGLETLRNLRNLGMTNNRLTEIKGLEKLINLEFLGVSDNKITEIKGLETLTSLKKLSISGNMVKQIAGLESLPNLESLLIRDNEITEIKGLESLENLKTLWLQNNKIKEIEGLQSLSNLEELDLCSNEITEIKGLEPLKKLKSLRLSNNQITEIKGFENLENLQSLVLSNNKIKEIKGLESLKKLKRLELNNNEITEIKGLDSLANLEALWISKNRIAEIKGLESLPNLKSLMLGENRITEIKGLESLTMLKDLSLQRNLITEYEDSEFLKSLRSFNITVSREERHSIDTDDISKRIEYLKTHPCLKGESFPVITEKEVKSFETKYGITLPEGYRRFILEIADGAIGGYMSSIIPLGYIFPMPGDKSTQFLHFSNIGKEFPFEYPWMPHGDIIDKYKPFRYTYPREMSDLKKNGSLIIENDGCGEYWNLIITGPQRGKVWRFVTGDILPCIPSMDFIEWFETIHEGKDPISTEQLDELMEKLREQLVANERNPKYNELVEMENELVLFIIDSQSIYESLQSALVHHEIYDYYLIIEGLLKCNDGRTIGDENGITCAIASELYKNDALENLLNLSIIDRSKIVFLSDVAPEFLKLGENGKKILKCKSERIYNSYTFKEYFYKSFKRF